MRPWLLLYALLHLVFALPTSASIFIKSAAPRLEVWNELSEKEKNLAYHLHRASKFGADILYFQNHKHALSIKSFLESAQSQNNLRLLKQFYGSSEKGRQRFEEFLAYSAQFFNQAGPYTTTNQKIFLKKTNFKEIKTLFKRFVPKSRQYPIDEIAKLMTDENFDAIRVARVQSLQPVQKISVQSKHPIGTALQKVVQELTAALPYALTDSQEKQLKSLIQFFVTGDEKQAPVVQDTDSKINFVMGFPDSRWQSCIKVKGYEETWAKAQAIRCEQQAAAAEVLDQPWAINADLELLPRGNSSLEGSAPFWTD